MRAMSSIRSVTYYRLQASSYEVATEFRLPPFAFHLPAFGSPMAGTPPFLIFRFPAFPISRFPFRFSPSAFPLSRFSAFPNMLPSSIRLSLRFDPARLQSDLDGIVASEYVPHFNTAYYQGDWSAVPLRSIGGRTDQIYPDPTKKQDFADTPLLARCPYIREVLATIACPQQSVRFLRLKAGSVIKEHRDYELGFEDGEVRLHVPVRTNPDVIFKVAGQRVVMAEGECWYSNFSLPHSVENRGATDRIHLVIDCVVNDWLRDRLLSDAANAVPQ